ncbi:major facilitator superfamily protein [Tolypothrix tenuis PCC 7101]|uniref:Major facilitator superfamily protein n=1 Tax=Tolypothrix tenuis PCC 7101 TaxID=231146 RepID=A0A1Z4MZY2_9CYAN|nr:AmpG family muropeptide MFS transporter [Aulosira sp. FACHB-113]BAY31218.1 major facilitator superfamily protein [Nostoc carneum NIES-2107]BAY98921.1 major facilitator superfamily protein [Tolypothrix tenuis PCC 7101]BAZ77160.1 major facilitator superfamily protein [Aulosira laxa NIES-50]
MNPLRSLLEVFGSRKMAALLFLGFSSGLPLLLIGNTLKAWMTVEQVDLAAIGWFSLASLPYSLKFLWSPFLDRFTMPFLGRRRGWLVVTQLALTVAIAIMAFQQPKQALQLLAINAIVIAFLSATQDIAADAYRTDVLEKLEMGAGAAVFILGYRIALLVAGALALILADRIPWSSVYLLMAGTMVLGIFATLFAPEPEAISPPASLTDAVILPFGEFFQRRGVIQGFLVLLFITLYKLGDALLSNMTTPFLLQVGFTKTDIGAIQVGMGLIATIVGALAGGAILSRIGINRSLWVFGVLQAVSNFAYLSLAYTGKNYQAMVLAINIEQFCGGLGTAAFVAFLMSLCNQKFSATQYALLSSLMAVSRDILASPGGAIAQNTGWPLFFIITIVAAVPGLLLLPIFAPWNPQPVAITRPGLEEEEEDVWGTK